MQLNIATIFKICLQRDVPEERMVKKRPMCVTIAATFVVNQKQVGLKHPFDLEADDVAGTFIKKEQTRFFEVLENDDGSLDISANLHTLQDANGRVTAGTINERVGSKKAVKWEHRNANLEHVYAVICKRTVH